MQANFYEKDPLLQDTYDDLNGKADLEEPVSVVRTYSDTSEVFHFKPEVNNIIPEPMVVNNLGKQSVGDLFTNKEKIASQEVLLLKDDGNLNKVVIYTLKINKCLAMYFITEKIFKITGYIRFKH